MKRVTNIISLILFGLLSASIWFYVSYFYEPKEAVSECTIYEDIDLIIPVEELLRRSVNSVNISMVKRAVINQWLYFNQQDIIKLSVYAQGSRSFDEMKKALQAGFKKEAHRAKAIAFIEQTIQKLMARPALIKKINQSLQQGYSPDLHQLKGSLMNEDLTASARKKLITQYRKKMYEWIDKNYGSMLDQLILDSSPAEQ